MTTALLASRLLLAGMFAVAGFAKLADRNGLAVTLRQFGLGPRYASAGACVLPVVELTVALFLIPAGTARAAAIAAFGLLTVFSAAIARALAAGDRFHCNCFGNVGSAPIGWTTLARNGVLLGLAVFVASRPASALGWVELAAAGGAALVVVQAGLWFELLRRYGRALHRIEELEAGAISTETLTVGAEAPPFVLPDSSGGLVALESLLAQARSTVLLFTYPGCGACEHLLDSLRGIRDGRRVVVVVAGPLDDVGETTFDLEVVLHDEHSEVSRLYGIVAVPTAVVIGPDGRVSAEPAVGAGEVEALLHASTSRDLVAGGSA